MATLSTKILIAGAFVVGAAYMIHRHQRKKALPAVRKTNGPSALDAVFEDGSSMSEDLLLLIPDDILVQLDEDDKVVDLNEKAQMHVFSLMRNKALRGFDLVDNPEDLERAVKMVLAKITPRADFREGLRRYGDSDRHQRVWNGVAKIGQLAHARVMQGEVADE